MSQCSARHVDALARLYVTDHGARVICLRGCRIDMTDQPMLNSPVIENFDETNILSDLRFDRLQAAPQ